MSDPDLKTSDAAVLKATGHDWQYWFAVLDNAGAKNMTHKEIVQMLADKKLIKSSWWCQQVTVVYEKVRGKRVLGETADAGFQIGVSKSIAVEPEKAWNYLISAAGRKLWLGEVDQLSLEKGAKGTTTAGLEYEIRSVQPGKMIRLRWQPAGFQDFTVLQLRTEKGKTGKTVIGFHHEKLAGAKMRTEMKKHWQEVLEQIDINLDRE